MHVSLQYVDNFVYMAGTEPMRQHRVEVAEQDVDLEIQVLPG